MFGKDRKRVNAEFAELTKQLEDVDEAAERELLHSQTPPIRYHQAQGPRDYSVVEDPADSHFQPPQPRHIHLRWQVWMTLSAALVMVVLPPLTALIFGSGSWWFWVAEVAATTIFVIGLTISLRARK